VDARIFTPPSFVPGFPLLPLFSVWFFLFSHDFSRFPEKGKEFLLQVFPPLSCYFFSSFFNPPFPRCLAYFPPNTTAHDQHIASDMIGILDCRSISLPPPLPVSSSLRPTSLVLFFYFFLQYALFFDTPYFLFNRDCAFIASRLISAPHFPCPLDGHSPFCPAPSFLDCNLNY